jgi:CRP-like cAMP-binding protein
MLEQYRKFIPVSDERWTEILRLYKRMEVPAKTILLKEGEVSQKAFLIESGCLRVWFNNHGKDVTFQFFFENEAVSSAESYRKKKPSFFNIEAIEPSVVYWIWKKDLDKIMDELFQQPDFSRRMFESAFDRQLHYMEHFLSFIKDTPAQRYQNLLKEKPHIIRRVPQQYIASYLGITPVSLSRIKARK